MVRRWGGRGGVVALVAISLLWAGCVAPNATTCEDGTLCSAAQAVARRVATSPLVKTAIAGGDPNWGRLLCAVGNAGVALRADKLGLRIGDVEVVRRGELVPGYREAAAAKVMKAASYTIAIDLGGGRHDAHYLACDLSHEYVSINADYRS